MSSGDAGLVGVAILAAWLILRRALRRRLRPYWRELAILIGLRRITPRRGERLPSRLAHVEPIDPDTGGAYRPSHRPQDPSVDPHEPYGSESSSTGSDHGWSGCTMSASADALAYATGGELKPWGGDMRHRQSDLSGGTDLYDARDAFRAYGEELTIRSGSGWSRVVDDHDAGRAIVIQGSGNVPGTESFDGGHACCIGTETRSSDGYWLWGDPLADGWQWVSPSSIRSWAERWQSSIAYAVTALPPAPDPDDSPPAKDTTPYDWRDLEAAADDAREAAIAWAVPFGAVHRDDELLERWLAWLRAPAPGPGDVWDAGSWADRTLELVEELDDLADPDPCAPGAPGRWSRGRLPYPAAAALEALEKPASWESSAWPAGLWRGSPGRAVVVDWPDPGSH